jgi:hypothetical protein
MFRIYTILLGVHIFAAIIGIGPSLLMDQIHKYAKNMSELRHAHKIVQA